jgi:hypothetical protein
MKKSWLGIAVVAPFLMLSSVQAQAPLISGVPPGKWKWYFALFNDVGAFAPPGIFSGSATVMIQGPKIRIEMEDRDARPGDKPPVFSGTINSRNQIKGVFDGLLTEDPRPTHGHYRKLRLSPGGCVNEVIVLEEDFRWENQLVLRRGTPAGC